MTDLTNELEVIIQKAALDGALTQDAVAQFHALVTERDALKKDNCRLDDLNTELNEKVNHFSQRVTAAETCAQEWAGREQDLMDREGTCTKLEVEKECAELRVKDHQKMVELIFRNSVIRKSVMTPVTPGPIDQYGTKQPDAYPSKDDVAEEET